MKRRWRRDLTLCRCCQYKICTSLENDNVSNQLVRSRIIDKEPVGLRRIEVYIFILRDTTEWRVSSLPAPWYLGCAFFSTTEWRQPVGPPLYRLNMATGVSHLYISSWAGHFLFQRSLIGSVRRCSRKAGSSRCGLRCSAHIDTSHFRHVLTA